MKTHFAQLWLNILCGSVVETHSAVFVVPDVMSNNAIPLAKWPEQLDEIGDFSKIIQFALKKSEYVCIPNVEQEGKHYFDYFALPVFIQTKLLGIIVLKSEHLSTYQQGVISNALHQGTQWLELAYLKEGQVDDFFASVMSLLVSCLEQKSYQESLIRLVAELTQILGCDRVVMGEFHKHHSKVVALSNSAQFDVRSNFLQKIADAMDEAVEQDCVINFPSPKTTAIQRAHQEIARKFGSGSLLTIPMVNVRDVFGAITLLRSEQKPFTTEEIRFCEQAVSLLTPYLILKKTDEQPLTAKLLKVIKTRFANFFGFKHLKIKLISAAVALLLLVASIVQGDFRLTADAVLEGKLQRVVAAPISGFLVSASVRAGDTVQQGDLMATLDDAELQLELSKLSGQLQKFRREYREALSIGDLVKVRVISAQIDQATAEMDLTQQQLQKINLKAPFNGIVIEGDLSQMLGSPVEQGDTLFKIAPLEGYRVILKVNERLISYLQIGQKGTLALSSLPDQKLDLTIQKLTAVAKAEDGENIFRVEANLDNAPKLLRPGMEGISKINAGRKPLLWIWTHETVDWLRLWLWSWSWWF